MEDETIEKHIPILHEEYEFRLFEIKMWHICTILGHKEEIIRFVNDLLELSE